MRLFRFLAWIPAALVLPAYAAQPPVPDPRLDPYYNKIAVAEIHRSVMFERTLPQPVSRSQPLVNEQDMKQLADNVFVERSLLPRGGMSDDAGAIRVFPRDVR